ncbi:MAG: DNA-binding response regulator [Candidatus Rokuibacteriota bacterium]|nr:MAG: DNA-binding response regulator [Candidatus Rokubacteria bacterium]
MRALLVEDDQKIASFIMNGLRQAGFAVDHAPDGKAGLELGLAAPYDVAVIDIMLPKRDGLTLIDELRRHRVDTRVLILSAKRAVDDRVAGLHAGGDDYLTKPFAFSELLARIHALLRRSGTVAAATRLTAGDIAVDLFTREVTRNGRRIELQAREYALLEYLMRNVGRPVSKTMILQHVWGYDFDPQTNVVEVLVSRLRHKLHEASAQEVLHTIRGVGYVLRVP